MKKYFIRYQVGRSKKNREFYWRIRAGNGEIIANGEGYKTKRAAMRVFNILSDAFDHMTISIQVLDAAGKPVEDVRYLGTLVTANPPLSAKASKSKCCSKR